MSLYIDVDSVKSVLIAGQWYDVDDLSFDLDSYEFHYENDLVHGGGQSCVCAVGFRFVWNGAEVSGPLTSIQAVSAQFMERRRTVRR